MKIEKVASWCSWIICPTVYRTDRGTYLIKGYTVSEEDKAQLSVSKGEDVVEIPSELIDQTIQNQRK